jgi:hypothetical protein
MKLISCDIDCIGCRVIQRILEHHSDQAVFERRFEVSGPPPYIVNELLHYGINLVQGIARYNQFLN